MDGNFLSRYDSKIKEYEENLKTNPSLEGEMAQYMLECVPYIKAFTQRTNNEDKHTIDTVFDIRDKKGIQKQALYKKYLYNVENQKDTKFSDPNEKKKKGLNHLDELKINNVCNVCKSSSVYIEDLTSDKICMDCGIAEHTIIEGNLSYKEEQEQEITFVYSYKRENHFNEWISQFQAQETTNIPDDVLEQLRCEFKKKRIKNLSEITHAKVRTLLKKLRYNKYYEHVPYITNLLNGVRPPSMSNDLEETLRKMFMDIQKPFDDHCPEERKNFLSYSYVLYKFCELLEKDDFLPCFPLLKSKEKLYQQDVIWKKICGDLLWEFIPTI
jgi:hypothetical protein